MTERQILQQETITAKYLEKCFGDPEFAGLVSVMAKATMKSPGFERGVVVYKKHDLEDTLFRTVVGDHFGVNLVDHGLKISSKDWVRVADIHFHLPGTTARFSDADIDSAEKARMNILNGYKITCAHGMLEVVGCVNTRESTLSIFGVSLSGSSLASNEYQQLSLNDSLEKQECIFRQSGFKTCVLNIPVNLNDINIQATDLIRLASLGA